jgi:hypothetical protein
MKTLIAAVAFAAVLAAPAFAQSVNAWGWKGGLAAPASAQSAYASVNGPRRGALSGRTALSGRIALSGRTYARECNLSPASPSYRTNCN